MTLKSAVLSSPEKLLTNVTMVSPSPNDQPMAPATSATATSSRNRRCVMNRSRYTHSPRMTSDSTGPRLNVDIRPPTSRGPITRYDRVFSFGMSANQMPTANIARTASSSGPPNAACERMKMPRVRPPLVLQRMPYRYCSCEYRKWCDSVSAMPTTAW